MSLANLNHLVRSESGVWQPVESAPFAYSDGEEAEQALAKIFAVANDLSSASTELEEQITDWPTEYHLSSKRANLLRPLDLSGCTTVLELGCGCGAISRYLGEQPGVTVDAVEGSAIRASLAAQRCRDLSNVTVHSANFNALKFPQAKYDLVLFVGVTEYAGRFSQQSSDQAALQELLTIAKNALKPDGVILIAIENRLGLKYLMGACEDHYGEPWVGLDDYPNSSGIRTYSLPEWQKQLKTAGFQHCSFAFPFPDYKVPSAVVHESAIKHEAAQTVIAKTQSRDYLRPFTIAAESTLWRGLSRAGLLPEMANSFLILLSQKSEQIEKLANFTVSEFPHTGHSWHQAEPQSSENEIRLQRKLAQLAEKNEQLEANIQLLKNSTGWRLINRFRGFFGRPLN